MDELVIIILWILIDTHGSNKQYTNWLLLFDIILSKQPLSSTRFTASCFYRIIYYLRHVVDKD